MGSLSRFWLLIEKALASEEEQVPTELDKAFFFQAKQQMQRFVI